MHYLTFDLDFEVKVIQNVAQYHLHHVTYAPAKFEVSTSNSVGGDAFTRNMRDGQTNKQKYDRQPWYKINICLGAQRNW